MKLRKQFLLLVGVPTIALLVLAGYSASSLKVEGNNSERFSALAKLSVFTSQTVHELQKERGASAGFIGSRGLKFGSIVSQQRKTTDQKLSALNEHLSSFDETLFAPALGETLSNYRSEYLQLNKKRASVDQLSISVPDQVRYYTGLNTLLLGISDELGRYSPTGEIANTGTAFGTFVQSKERAVLERAILSNAFSQKKFTNGGFRKFTDLVNTQAVYLEVFSSNANPSMLDALVEAQRDASFDDVERMRRMAIDASETGRFTIDPEVWFKTITVKIGKLKEVENLLLDIVLQAAEVQAIQK
ncbi:MAG: nitrate- and nitrite sensing domain-containing protein [Granulosicoccus sp.]